jgi:hypothetical protein
MGVLARIHGCRTAKKPNVGYGWKADDWPNAHSTFLPVDLSLPPAHYREAAPFER